jgi:hypothetical protein
MDAAELGNLSSMRGSLQGMDTRVRSPDQFAPDIARFRPSLRYLHQLLSSAKIAVETSGLTGSGGLWKKSAARFCHVQS